MDNASVSQLVVQDNRVVCISAAEMQKQRKILEALHPAHPDPEFEQYMQAGMASDQAKRDFEAAQEQELTVPRSRPDLAELRQLFHSREKQSEQCFAAYRRTVARHLLQEFAALPQGIHRVAWMQSAHCCYDATIELKGDPDTTYTHHLVEAARDMILRRLPDWPMTLIVCLDDARYYYRNACFDVSAAGVKANRVPSS